MCTKFSEYSLSILWSAVSVVTFHVIPDIGNLCLLSFYLSLSFSYKDTVSGSFLEERFCGLEVGLAKIMQDAIAEESKEQRRSQLLGENDALGLHRLSQLPHLSS